MSTSTNDFYVSLESNADLQNHPDNKPNSFKITLQTPIDLAGEWETGLAQLIFPHSWHDAVIKEANQHHHHLFLIKLHIKGDAGDDNTKTGYWRDLHIKPTQYHTIKDLLLAIRLSVEESKPGAVEFIYRPLHTRTLVGQGQGQDKIKDYGPIDINHLRINCTDGNVLALPAELGTILSYDIEGLRKYSPHLGISITPNMDGRQWLIISTSPSRKYDARQYIPARLDENISLKIVDAERDIGLFQNIYINSDLIQTQFVGDTRANVLRIIAPQQEKGQVETFNFTPIFYFPLRVIKFNTIEINITGDTGRLVPFEGGVVVVVLHLRRKHNIIV